MTEWPEKCDEEELKPYDIRSHERSCEQSCVLWGSRVIIPQVFRERMLKELHWEHPSTCAMKAIARTYVWWPTMDEEIDKKVKLRTVCQNVRSSPPNTPLLPWKWATRPFQRIHMSKGALSIFSRDQ